MSLCVCVSRFMIDAAVRVGAAAAVAAASMRAHCGLATILFVVHQQLKVSAQRVELCVRCQSQQLREREQ